MPKSLSTETDVEILVKAFYNKVLEDDRIGHFFSDHMEATLDAHIPQIVAFWCSLIFSTSDYKGNPMLTHINLNQKSPLIKDDFDSWLSLWEETVHQYFVGPNADLAIEKAHQIAQLIQIKIKGHHSPLTIL